MFVPKPILLWIFVSSVIVCFDAFFVLNRPDTLKGGKYYGIFQLYENYYRFDTLYNMNDDLFVVIQSWLNIAEAVISLFAILMCLAKCPGKKLIGAFMCLIVSAMIFWKTVIFVWYDHSWLTEDARNFCSESIMYYYIPSSFWIVMPFVSMLVIGGNIWQKHMGLVKEKGKNA